MSSGVRTILDASRTTHHAPRANAKTHMPSLIDSPSPAAPVPSPRLMSLDALRGFDMFWIMGGDALAAALHKVGKDRVTEGLATQLEHVEWAGFHFYETP